LNKNTNTLKEERLKNKLSSYASYKYFTTYLHFHVLQLVEGFGQKKLPLKNKTSEKAIAEISSTISRTKKNPFHLFSF
jgi:hypothetical protein